MTAGFVAMLIWGGQLPIAKGAYAAVDGVTMTLVRYSVAFVAFTLLLAWREGRSAFVTDRRGWMVAGVAGAALASSVLLLFVGLATTRPEVAVIILALQPAMTALAQWVLERRSPAGFTLACIVAAFVGVILVVTGGASVSGTGQAGTREGELFGNLLAFMASIAWVAYAILTARIVGWSTLRVSALTSIPALIVVALVWAVAQAFGQVRIDTAELPAATWRLAYVSVLGVVVAMFLWNEGLQQIGAVNAMLLANLMPVVTFSVRAFEGARFAPMELVGAAIVVGALLANSLWLRRRAAVG